MLIPVLVFAVLAIVLIFGLVKSAETWSWIPITFIALIFLTSIFGGIAVSRSWKVRAAWVERYNENLELLAKTKAEFENAVYGSPESIDGYGTGSLRDVSARLNLTQIGKGRIWRGGQPVRDNEQYRLTFTPPAGTPSPAAQMSKDMQLYAFADGGATIDGVAVSVPSEFVGTFKVVSVDAASNVVVLEPLFLTKYYRTGSLMRQLSAELGQLPEPPAGAAADATDGGVDPVLNQAAKLASDLGIELSDEMQTGFESLWAGMVAGDNVDDLVTWLNDKATAFEPAGNWALFEKMPGDRRMVFKDHMGMAEFSEENPATPELLAEYRAALQNTYLPATLMHMDPESVEYEELLDEYTFEGAPLNVVNQYLNQNSNNRINERFDPSRESRWGRIVFNATSEAFPVDQEGGNFQSEGTFNFNGLAIDEALHHGEDVTFRKDEELVVPMGWIDGFRFGVNDEQPPLTSTNDASFTEIEYYRRPIRDYPFLLREFRNLTRKTAEQQQALAADLLTTDGMIGDARSQIRHRDALEIDLRADLERMERDLQTINQLHDQRDAELEMKREKIRTYYNQIIELYKQSQAVDGSLNTFHGPPSGDSLADRR